MLPVHVKGTSCNGFLKQENLISLQMPGVHVGQFLFRWYMWIQNGLGQAHVEHRELGQWQTYVMTAMAIDAWVA